MMVEIREREVAAQVVLTEQRSVGPAALTDWLRTAMDRLGGTAAAHGGLAGPMFVVYHGQLVDGVEVPVEVCAPIDPTREAGVDAATRREPAHCEAYLTLRKEQVEPAQVGAAFAAVAQWTQAQGLLITDSPREVYFTDFAAAGPADEVFDVAFPIGR